MKIKNPPPKKELTLERLKEIVYKIFINKNKQQ